jgi:hypothetical protein
MSTVLCVDDFTFKAVALGLPCQCRFSKRKRSSTQRRDSASTSIPHKPNNHSGM